MKNEGSFADLGLGPRLVSVLEELGYEEPTPIQRDAIPPLLAGRDIVGQAGTGTGKTAAFALPLLQRALGDGPATGPGPSVLVLVPTRELAMQVAEATYRYGRHLGARVLPIYGGQSIALQFRGLQRGVDVVVATPGRALDHVRRATLNLGHVQAVVLDEADEMLDMGFADELEAILSTLPTVRQTALFTATMPQRITVIAERHLQKPVRIAIPDETTAKGTAPRVRQVVYLVSRAQKIDALGRILDLENPASALVFCRTRGEVDMLADTLNSRGYKAEALHGGMSQHDRDRVMRRFREGTAELLLATDVAARGLDIGRLSHVINYDVPPAAESYVHRIGRTGRAGRAGVAITLAEPKERSLLRNIERLTGRKLEIGTVPSLTDLRARRLDMTRASLKEAVAAGGNEGFRSLVESLVPEFDVVEVAAAAVRLIHEAGERSSELASTTPEPSFAAPSARPETERPPSAPAPRTPHAKHAGTLAAAFAKIYVSIGKDAGVEPADLLSAITGGSKADAGAVGTVAIEQRFSLVDVRADRADAILEALRASTIRGQRVTASRYDPDRPKKKKTSGAARARERKARLT
ncbi:MAG TPA: DEAD/DEAH box helicase [Vicinamibacteria bacterium]|nr:DEAD/DEAH box helicase [Vicinamibacteria bacterium]